MARTFKLSVSDQALLEISNGEITNRNFVTLTKTRGIPNAKGLYDPRIFGSDRKCSCGIVKAPRKAPCIKCKVSVLEPKELVLRMAHIKLPAPIVYPLNITKVSDIINSLGVSLYNDGSSRDFLYNLWNTEFKFKEVKINDENANFISLKGKYFHVTGVELNQKSKLANVGTIGLMKLSRMKSIHGDSTDIESALNQIVLVPNPIQRPLNVTRIDGKIVATAHPTTYYYNSILYFKDLMGEIEESYSEGVQDIAALHYYLNSLVNQIMQSTSSILKPSKESAVRGLFSIRVPSSQRATVVGDPSLKIDEIRLPRSLVYHQLQTQIIESISENHPELNPVQEYLNATPIALETLEDICKEATTLSARNPTLHRLNIQGLKIKLWDEATIGMPIMNTKPLNLDFDGDQMLSIIETRPEKVALINEYVSPKNIWHYEKNLKPIFVPNDEILYGLYLATDIDVSKKPKLRFKTMEEIESSYLKHDISHNTPIYLNEKITTWGREKVGIILGCELDKTLGEGVPINIKNIGEIVSNLQYNNERLDILHELQNIGTKFSTEVGVPTLSLASLYGPSDDPRIQTILKSDMDNNFKLKELKAIYSDVIIDRVKSLPDNNLDKLINASGRVSYERINEVLRGSPMIDSQGVFVDRTNLAVGMSERSYVNLAMEQRQILEMKQNTVPISGYNARQIGINQLPLRYKEKKTSTDKVGVKIPKKVAIGRTLLNGDKVSSTTRSDKDGNVVVKSIINASPKTVYLGQDLLSDNFSPWNGKGKIRIKEGAYIGIAFAQAETEFLTQGMLKFKHGGDIISYSEAGISLESECEFVEEKGYFLTVRTQRGLLTFYTGINGRINPTLISSGKASAGTTIIFSVKKEYADHRLAKISKFLGTQASRLKEKGISSSISFAPVSGKLHYDIEKGLININGTEFQLMEEEIYFIPEGARVKAGEQLSSGLLNTSEFYDLSGRDIHLTFTTYYNQFTILSGSKFPSEIIETTFWATRAGNFSVMKSISQSEDAMRKIYFSRAQQNLTKLSKTGEDLVDSSAILNIVLGT